jgi:hypothetical protein
MGTLQRKVALASTWARVDGETTEQTIHTGVTVLHRIIVTADGAAATLTVSDGPAGTPANILNVLEVPSGESREFKFGTVMSIGVRVTPGEATTDSTIILKKIAEASLYARVQNENTEQVIKSTPGILQKIIVTGNGAAAVVTVSDGPSVAITSSSIANPTVITTGSAHGLTTGDTVVISGHTGSTPSINGTHIATVTGASTFTIPVNVTVGGTGGTTNIVNILEVPINQTRIFKFGVNMLSDIRVTPAAITDDITVVYD